MKSVVDEIEKQLDQLSRDEQLWLIQELARRLRDQHSKAWADDLATMAADPEIQAELRNIERE